MHQIQYPAFVRSFVRPSVRPFFRLLDGV